ncbi:MAG: four helix bundle protein [Acidobacteriaceae bacterium]
MGDYRNLLVWRKAMLLTETVYRATETFPRSELYGLTSQLRRAAVSIPSNIAEGQGRGYDGQFVQFLRNARGSLLELETQVILSTRLGYLEPPLEGEILAFTREIGKLLNGLSKSIAKPS